MFLQESRDDVGAERERHTAIVFTPPGDIFVGVGPEKVTEKAAIGDLIWLARQHLSFLEARKNRAKEPLDCAIKDQSPGSQLKMGTEQTYIGRTHDATDLLHRV